MECKSCGSKWEQSLTVSKTLILSRCPFCGADMVETEVGNPQIYDNSRDALAHIRRTYGEDVLLGGKLLHYLLDFVPTIETKRKNVIKSIITPGVTHILRKGMTSGAEEQGRIYRQAVQKVVDDYGTERSLVEGVMLEFTEALGWNVKGPSEEEAEKKRAEEERKTYGLPKPLRVQGASVPKQGEGEDDRDVLFSEAGRLIINKDNASIAMLQRWFKIGFNRAARIMDQLAEAGVVSEEVGTKPRKVLMSMEEFEQYAEEQGRIYRQEERKRREEEQKRTQAAGSFQVGQRNVQFGPYKWRVLDVQNGRALLLAEKVLEKRKYHSAEKVLEKRKYHSFDPITWEKCDLRKYLNGKFLQRFHVSEQSRVAEVINANPDNPWNGTSGGSDTRDKVFLLSIDEVVRYFGDSGELKARNGGSKYRIDDQYSDDRKTRGENNAPMWWWLRSPGSKEFDAARVGSDGNLDISGFLVDHEDGGVRPALWLNL